MQYYTVILSFGQQTHGYADFLDSLPYILQHICRDEISFDIIRSERVMFTNLRILVGMPIQACATLSHGVRDPAQASCTVTLMLWLNSLRIGEPLRKAWAAWCRLKDMALSATPIYLLSHGFRATQMVDDDPCEPTNLTPHSLAPTDPYDGITQTTTRVP